MATRAVLGQGVTRDAIDDAAARNGWQLSNVLPAATGRPAQLIFTGPDRHSFLYFVDEQNLGVAYLTASGHDAVAMLATARQELTCQDEPAASLRSQLEREPSALDDACLADIRRGLAVTAIATEPGASDPGTERVTLIADALRHADYRVRSVAITAASYAAWPALRSALQRMAADDEVPALRQAAEQLDISIGGQT